MMHIVGYFKKDHMCLHCHCTELVAGGGNNPGSDHPEVKSTSREKGVLPTRDERRDVGFKMEPGYILQTTKWSCLIAIAYA